MGDIPITPIIVVIIGAIFTSGGNSLNATTNAPLKQPTLWLGVVKVPAESAKLLLNPNWLSNSSGEKEWINVTVHCNDSNVPVHPFLSLAKNFSCRHPTTTSSDGLLAWCIIDAREAYGELKQTLVAHGSDRILSAVNDFIRSMKHLYVFNATKEEGQDTKLSSPTDSTILQVEGQPLGYKEPPKLKNLLMKQYEVVTDSKEMQAGATTQSNIPTDQLVTNMALLKSGSSLSPKPTTVENASSGEKQSIPKPQQTATVWVSIFKQLLKLNQFNCESNNDRFTGNLGVDSTSTKSNGLSKTGQDSLSHKWGNNSFNSTALKKHERFVHEANFESQLRKTKSTSGISHVLRKARDEQPIGSKSNKRSHQSPSTINSDVINSQVKYPTQGTADERTGGRPASKKLADMKPEVGPEVKRPENNTNAVRSRYMTAGGKTATPKNETFNLKLGQKEPGVKSGDRTGMLKPKDKRQVVEPEIRRPVLKPEQKQPGVKSGKKTATPRPGEKKPVLEPGTGRPVLKPEQKQPGVKSGNKTATPRPGEKKPVLEPGSGRPVIKPEQNQPGVKSGKKTATPRPGEKKPVLEPGSGRPVLKPEQKPPGVKSGKKTATPRPGEKKPVLEPGTGRPVLKPEQKQPGVKSGNKTATPRPGEKKPVLEPGSGRPVIKPEQNQPGVKSGKKTATPRPGEKKPVLEPGSGRPVLKPEQKPPGVKSGNKTATPRPGEKKPVLESGTGRPVLKPEQKQPGVESGKKTATPRPREKKPVLEPGTGKPVLKPEQKQPGVKSGSKTATPRPGEKKPVLEPGTGRPVLKPEQKQPSVKSGSKTATPRPEEKRPVLEPGTGRPLLKPEQKQPGVKSGNETATPRSGEKKPVLKPGSGRPVLKPEQIQPGVKSGKKTATPRPGEKKPVLEPGSGRPVLKPELKPPGVKSGNKAATPRPGEKKPVLEPGSGQPVLKPEQKQPGVKSGKKTVTPRPGEKRPVLEPGTGRPVLKPEQKQPGVKSGKKTATPIFGEKKPVLEPGTGRPVLKSEQKQPGVKLGNKTATPRPGEKKAVLEPGSGRPVLKPEQKQPGVKSGNKTATPRPGEKRPVLEPGTGRPVLKPEQKQPGVKSGNKTATPRPVEKKPVLEPGTTRSVLKSEQKQSGVKSGNKTTTPRPIEKRPVLEPGTRRPVVKPEQKQPGFKSGNKTVMLGPEEKRLVAEPATGRSVFKPEQKQPGVNPENITATLSPEEKRTVAEPATGRSVLKPGVKPLGVKTEHITATPRPEGKRPLIEPRKGPVFKLEQKHGVKTGIKTTKLRPGQKKTSIEPGNKQLGLKPEQNPGIKSGDRRADLKLEEMTPLIKPVGTEPILLLPKDKRPSARPKDSRPGFEPLPLAGGSSIYYNKPVAHSSIVVLFPSGHFPSNTMTAANDVRKRQHLHNKVGLSMGQGDTRHPSHSPRFSRNLGVDTTSTTSNVLSKGEQDSFLLKNGNYTFLNSKALTKHLKSVREANLDSELNGIEEYLSGMPNGGLRNAREEQSGGRESRNGGRQPPAGINSHAGTLQVKHPDIKIPEKQGLQAEGAAGKQIIRTVDERTGVRSNTKKRAHMKPAVRPGNERSVNKTSAVRAGDIGADGKRPRLEDKRPDLKQACVTPGDGTAILRPRMNRPLIEPRTGAVLQREQQRPGINSRDRQAEHRHGENIPLIKPETGQPVLKPELKSGIKSRDGTAMLRPRINRPLLEPRTGPFLKSEQKRPGINSGDRQVEHRPGKQRGLIEPVAKNHMPLRTNNKRPKDRPVGSQTLPAAPISSAIYTKPEAHSSIVVIFPSGYLPNNPIMVENDIRKKQYLHNKASASIRQGDTRRSSIPPHAGTLGSRTPEPATRVQISNVVLVNPHEASLQMVRARCGNTVREGPRAFMSCVKDSGMLDGGSSGRQLRVETKREANDPGNKSFPLGNPMNASQSANKQRDTLGQSKIGNVVNELQGKLLAGMMTQLGTERPPQSSVIQEGGSASSRLPLSTTVENKSQLNMTVVAVQVAKLYLELGGYLNKDAKARLAVEDCSVAVYESLREFVECVEKAQAYEVGGPIESILPQSSHRDQGLVVVASRAQERDRHAGVV